MQELKKKLLEESYELARAKTKDEIASELSDVLEVILAIAGACRITCASLEKNVL